MDYVHRANTYERPVFDSPLFTLMASHRPAPVVSPTAATRIDRDAPAHMIRNDLGVPILVFLRDTSGEMSPPAMNIRIAARSAMRVPRGGHLVIDRFEPIARDVGVHAAAAPGTDEATRTHVIGVLQSALKQGPHQWPEARDRVVLAAELAHLVLVASTESQKATRLAENGVRYRIQSYLLESGLRQLQAEVGIDERVESIYAAVRDLAQGTLPNAEGVRAVLRELIAVVDREGVYHAAFEGDVALQLDQMVPCGVTAAHPVTVISTRRINPSPPAVTDVLEIEADADSGLAVLVGEVSYDRDTTHAVIFRRITGTNRWLGRLHWPSSSSDAQLRVRPPGGWTWTDAPGPITTGRRSLTLLQILLEAHGTS